MIEVGRTLDGDMPLDVPSSTIPAGFVVSFLLLVMRLCTCFARLLVVLEGIAGPPILDVCGRRVEPVRFKPDSGIANLEVGAGAFPVSAANDCALAASEPAFFSLESSGV